MPKVVSATEARVHFGELLQRVSAGETVMVERGGLLQAVVLPAQEYQRMLTGLEPEAWRERARVVRERIRAEVTGADIPLPERVLDAERGERDERLADLR